MFQNKVFLAHGSNVGNWKVNFNHCLIEIQKIGQLTAIGNIYVSNPYGFSDQNNFYNTAFQLSPMMLRRNLLFDYVLEYLKLGPECVKLKVFTLGDKNV